jgi:hypothetical protein
MKTHAAGHRPCAFCGVSLGVSDYNVSRIFSYVVPACPKHATGELLRPFAKVLDTTKRGQRYSIPMEAA